MAVDWDKHVLAPLHKVFGERVQFQPVGGTAYDIASAVFDRAYTTVEVVGGMEVSSVRPVLGIRSSQFTGAVAKQGDRFKLYATNETFVVQRAEPDSHGEIKYLLNLQK